jgi:uncharacterized protein with NAD-binding domain and iron-sulfur cluster
MARRRSATRARPIRVAIVGGGCAAVATAFELTRPEHQGRYAVTLYQMGWRLGGKGASGRGPNGRIEEHGLHVWMGWYENAFRLLRECYAELTGDADAWRRAFLPSARIAVTDRLADGTWVPWIRDFPPAPGLPGDPAGPGERFDVRDYARRTIALVRSLLEGLRFHIDPVGPATTASPTSAAAALSILDGLVAYGETATLAAVSQAALSLEILLGHAGQRRGAEPGLLRFVEALHTHARRLLESRLERDLELRRIWHIAELGLATVRGYVTSGLLSDPRGFDTLDDVDCREWLRRNGASEAALDCGYLRGLYDLGFGYEDGDVGRPSVSAAQALRGFLRAFFTYRGAFFWKMRGGMGDVVFAPFHDVLRRRGVRFRFFHRLTDVRLGRAGGPHVAGLEFDVQARLRPGRREYEPLVEVRDLRCWPSAPRWEQLAGGARLRRERRDFESHWDRRRAGRLSLRVGRDFDLVVLGIGLGEVPFACRELVAGDPRWQAMVDHVKTVPTQALQLWLRPSMPSLGWSSGPVTLSGFAPPFDTWADMGHLLPLEDWESPPGALAYFCGVLRDAPPRADDLTHPARRHAEVSTHVSEFLARQLGHVWPDAVDRQGRFRKNLIVDRFWRANVNPSDRYTLSLPGTARYRLSPLDPTYDNLTICGDWTDTGLSGCVEAAVMSGRLAAHALTRQPALEDIVGYDHP